MVIDGNYLYGSIMSKLGIYIDRCVSSESLYKKINIKRSKMPNNVKINDEVDTNKYIR